jgi:hypothetical protein
MAPKGKSASKAETEANLGFEAKLWQMADGEPFEEKMKQLAATLREQQAEVARLDDAIAVNLPVRRSGSKGGKELGYGE